MRPILTDFDDGLDGPDINDGPLSPLRDPHLVQQTRLKFQMI
jgi:hypothetical protein